jgi:hypothetical protein
VTLSAPLVVPTGQLANLRLVGKTVTGLFSTASVVCPNADGPRTSRESKRTVPPMSTLVPYFVGLELKLWK